MTSSCRRWRKGADANILPEEKEDGLDRQRKAKIFMGKLVELQCAAGLEDRKWRIHTLEAPGGKRIWKLCRPRAPTARLRSNISESKIGISLNPSGGRAVSLHAASDFAFFKLYTAAVQLKLTSKWCSVGLVISDYLTLGAVSTLAIPERDGRTTARLSLMMTRNWNEFFSAAKEVF